MNPIATILNDYPIMITDGAMATELERYGCHLLDPLWSATVLTSNPELIKQVHLDYFEAGADCAITATYQATVAGFVQKGFSKAEAKNLIKKAVTLAVEARDDFWNDFPNKTLRPKPLIAGSVGPFGAYLADGSEYSGTYDKSKEDLYAFHQERFTLLMDAEVDLLACETIPSKIEAEVLAELLQEFPDISAWITFSAKDDVHINDGSKISDCAALLRDTAQVAAIGINCTSPYYVENLIREIKKVTDKPIIVYPNSGEVYNPTTKTWNQDSAIEQFNTFTKQWYQAGATIIGGCCRTTPKDIAALASWARG